MIFTPRNTKFNKSQKGKRKNLLGKYKTLKMFKKHSYYLNTLESGQLSSKQLQTLYDSLNKYIKKSGKVFLKVFAHCPKTKKPLEVRMGKGKGSVAFWIAKVSTGTLLCEILTISPSLALKALIYAKKKLPIKTKICFY